jgi:hypothetical protein
MPSSMQDITLPLPWMERSNAHPSIIDAAAQPPSVRVLALDRMHLIFQSLFGGMLTNLLSFTDVQRSHNPPSDQPPSHP